MAKQNLGMVTAYAYAVVGGYEGTEAEFEALLGNIATDLAEIENLTVIANTLPAGSQATASYSNGVLTLGIPKGDTGATGAGATVTTGTTATGDPGTNASVTNSGTTKDAVFNFTIPRGDTGNGIESIYLTGTSGAVKTYTILFTDGTTTTFDVTDGEVTNATLTAVLADYAKIDGAYESMTVGNAEQLVSTVFVNDEEPYNFRTSGGSADIGDREYDTVVGGTVAWNQLIQMTTNWATESGITIVEDTNDHITFVSPARATSVFPQNTPVPLAKQNSVYLVMGKLKAETAGKAQFLIGGVSINSGGNVDLTTDYKLVGSVIKFTGVSMSDRNVYVAPKALINVNISVKKDICCFDLTAMFGSTIADYIYSLEQANAGAGVAWFRKLFPKPYYAYNAGELMSVQAVSHDMIGFNQLGGSFVSGKKWNSGTYEDGSTNQAANSFKAKCLPNTQYCFCMPQIVSNIGYYRTYFDADGTFITKTSADGINSTAKTGLFTTPSNAYYVAIDLYRSGGFTATELEEACLNIAWDGERDGEYEPYVKRSYALDDSLTLRGIPKLDASNNLYYDGDTYESDGTVTRKYGIVDLGTLNWTQNVTGQFYTNYDFGAIPNNIKAIISDGKYKVTTYGDYNNTDKQLSFSSASRLWMADADYTSSESFKTAMSGVYLVYELATPTIETADPFQSPQIVDDFGTEEYVDYAMSEGDRDVAIPVGHKTKYTNNLRAKLEMSPNSPDGAGDYLVRQTNGINEYVSLASNATIQDMLARIEALEGGGE